MGVPEGVVGPVEAELRKFGQVKGLVFGAFGEASEEVHDLVQWLAGAKGLKDGHGRPVSKGDLAKRVGQVRKVLGVRAVQVQAQLLLDRLRQVRLSAGGEWMQRLAQREGEQRCAVEAAEVQARYGVRGVHRGGQPLVSCS